MRRAAPHLIVALALIGCSRAETKTKTEPAAAAGAPGAGDRSGKSIANARALVAGTPTVFQVPCTGEKVYVGPFTMRHDPERLVVRASVKGTSASQVCIHEGHWVDARGEHPAIAGLPCVEGAAATETKLEYEYSPGNGGSSMTPVYWQVRHSEPKPACETVTVTLSL